MLITPEIRELQAVIALVHEHGFAGAAKSLGVSQPSVSMRIAKLEQIFGFTLFHRRPEGNVLTEEGMRLLPIIRNINSEYNSLLSRVSYWRRAQNKTLKILADGS
ncbi:LysR family transcriptional regulator [Luteolibacter algae]|uniref:LysR family transcriptional regulator n=1 Tax=Luteolibacter algae TaxID=454151 RepID=A0ABW5D5K3_9BACT